MKKYTQKQLKEFVRSGVAVNITASEGANKVTEQLEKIGYSSGVYGINGALFKGVESGTLYAIIARSSTLFLFW